MFVRSTNHPVGVPGNGLGRLVPMKTFVFGIVVACATPPPVAFSAPTQAAVALLVAPAFTLSVAVRVMTLVAPFVPLVPFVPFVPLVPGVPGVPGFPCAP